MTIFQYFLIIHLLLFSLFASIKFLIQFKKTGRNPIVLGKGGSGFHRFLEKVYPLLFVIWLFELISYALQFNWKIMPDMLLIQLIDILSLKYLGMILASFALIFFVLSLLAFGDSWRVGVDSQSPGELVTRGVFRFSRNPIYVAIDLWFVGTFLIVGTVFFAIGAIFAILILHYQTLMEERFLKIHYGAPYHEYCQRVRRYI